MRLPTTPTTRGACLVAAIAAVSSLAACKAKQSEAATVQTTPVQRQSVVVDVEATGVIQPIGAVDVRSKASGQIVAMPVQTGSQVKSGDLLVRIDPRDPTQRYDQAKASLSAAQAQLSVTRTQYERNQQLSKQGVITAPELESARIAYANAQSQVVNAQTQLQLAQIALEDVTIQAPSAGTIISVNVAPGQVIASSTNSPSGGTILLTLANLSTIYDSTLVNESDIGKVKAGQTATVTVDAYPGRTFRGVVEKIEPRATVQQSVTMFPVKIRINNEDGALMPGMNSDVSILIDDREGVIAVPVDAVRSLREAGSAAAALGLDSNAVKAAVQAQGGGRPNGGNGGNGGGARGPGGDTGVGAGVAIDTANRGARGPQGNGGQGGPNGQGGQGGQGGRGFGGPPPSAAQCDSVTKAYAKHPKQKARLDSLQQAMRDGAIDFNTARETMRALYDSIGVDARVARGCRGNQPGGQGGQGGQGNFAGGGAGAGGAGGFGGGARGGRGGMSRGLVFVKNGTTYEPRVVQLGLGNFDVIEVTNGLKEGEQVALVSGALLQANRQALQNRIRSNSGVPGIGGGGGGGGAGGGGPRGGGGGGPRGG